MREEIRKVFRWIYDWVTVLVGSAFFLVTGLPELLTTLNAIDVTPLVGAPSAVKWTTGTAIAKGVLSWYVSEVKRRRAEQLGGSP